ncbi:hypothetical protein CEXT_409121 [Caerostris extrusa]|uniref:Uncharacterized protein n=1 Tax=Caerostris extrusa TaxID=172846 RepID=A0AAV4UWG3_CAEEX|nr:hypothetical protein CEXT_409121 [Caerostris extrusa]
MPMTISTTLPPLSLCQRHNLDRGLVVLPSRSLELTDLDFIKKLSKRHDANIIGSLDNRDPGVLPSRSLELTALDSFVT